jgi:hypothetical protein
MFDLDKKSLYWTLPKIKGIPLTLTVCPDQEKMVAAYDTNRIMVFDINNRCLHQWSRMNDDLFPLNFLKRYNRMIGSTALSSSKFLFYTIYTYCILVLTKGLPSEEVKIIQDHPGKPLDQSSTWFECIKKSQAQYLDKDLKPSETKHELTEGFDNLTISNSIKGILHMQFNTKTSELSVIENQWRKAVERFPGTLALPKYGM